ncbi:NADPH dehydrogenase NamA [Alkalihalobacillus sp. BA299]|uniref:NADPH dehydrogenase NamA n=1 Tax=Alkalihalobacillus sp. BA299 TaxID=2815938 RepID=UPI001ADC1A72|nr:NADPH dehydrogenase NamA [Alkalihalobacillus sp. BA299]
MLSSVFKPYSLKKLFEPYTIRNLTLKNRIVMSPMCMYSCYNKDGRVTDWHLTHYTTRAVGQVGLILTEATAVSTEGRIKNEDLGIWDDAHISGLSQLTDWVHANDAKIGIQLAHAGRKSKLEEPIIAPSAIPFSENSRVPGEMSLEKIEDTINAFRQGARRARMAGFDVIEIHAAHGYLIHEFLSPLSNKRTDHFGGTKENRYRFLKKIIEGIREEWNGPLFVRVSANDYDENGNNCNDFVEYAKWMKDQGVDLIDCSSGEVVPSSYHVYPGYQIQYAEQIRKEAKIPTGAVGVITEGVQAAEIVHGERADLVFIGRELLRDPYWPLSAAKQLKVDIEGPRQYRRGWNP